MTRTRLKRNNGKRRLWMRFSMQGGSSRPLLRDILWGKTRGHCWLCGRVLALDQTTVEHLHPVSRGGPSIESNTVAACQKCNKAKGNQTLAEYRSTLTYAAGAPVLFWGERQLQQGA